MAIWCKLKRSPSSVCDFTKWQTLKSLDNYIFVYLIDFMMQTQSVTRQKRLKSRFDR